MLGLGKAKAGTSTQAQEVRALRYWPRPGRRRVAMGIYGYVFRLRWGSPRCWYTPPLRSML